MIKIQRIQNRATRFITNNTLLDRIRSEDLHATSKLVPMNIRYAKLANKQLNKIKEKFYGEQFYFNKGTDYEITEEPKRQKQKSLFQTIQENIYINPDNCPWNNPTPIADWTPPEPIYK